MSVTTAKKRTGKDVPVKADPNVTATASGGTTPRPVDALTLRKQVDANLALWNNWRENLNPLLGLTIQRARYLLESYPRGIMADYAWTLFFVEQSDADLMALIERRTSALLEMDWSIKAPAKDRHGRPVDAGLAKAQTAALQEAYDGIDNLYEAVEHLALATFRGYAHCEQWRNADGDVTHLEIIDPWNVCRQGLKGPWKYNPMAIAGEYMSFSADLVMDPADFLIRDVRRPVGRIALLKYIRQNLCDRDWDAFVEIYGIPGWVIIGPPNVPPEKEAEYQSAAKTIAQGGSGYLPNGADAKASDGPRGVSPFKERLDFLSEKLILAGTGGKLTMLAESGSGTLAGNAHQETFQMIARSEARKINEIFQRQFDARILETLFPGQPRVAYFELAANEETDVEAFIADVEKLGRAGYQVDEGQIEEKTGYKATLKPDQLLPKDSQPEPAGSPTVKPGTKVAPPVKNRAQAGADAADMGEFLANCRIELGDALVTDFKPLADALQTVVDKSDVELPVALAVLKAHLPMLRKQILAAPATAAAYQDILAPALVDGLDSGSGEEGDPVVNARSKSGPAGSHWVTIEGRRVLLGSKGEVLKGHLRDGNGSTSGEESSKKKDAHEQSKSTATSAGKSGEAGAGTGGGAGRATRDVVERAAGANTEGRLGLGESNARQKAALAEQHARGEGVVTHDPSRKIGEGVEHLVEHADGGRVLKHTKSGFGVTLEPHVAPFGGYMTLRQSTPQEYMRRLDASNHLFGDDARVEGVSKIGDHVGLAVSQRAIKGVEPSPKEVKDFMVKGGFRQVKAEGIDNVHMADKTWYHPESGHVVSDVKPDNFKKDASGRIIPIDLIVQHAPAGSDLRIAVESNL